MKQLINLLLSIFILSSCYKPVYTEYFDEENYTEFTTHEILLEIPSERILKVFASRRCPGKTICEVTDIKILITLETKFSFLEGKDFYILTDNEKIDVNHRRYTFSYDAASKYIDGTTGFAREKWVVWLKANDFEKLISSEEVILLIGDYKLNIETSDMEKWETLIKKDLLVETMEEEQKRNYSKYVEAPISESEVREKFEKKAFVEAEEKTWDLVKDSENPEDLRFFLEQYPDSPFATPARLKLKQLERELN